jgi:ferredoxin
MTWIRTELAALGVDPGAIRTEVFGAGAALTPGVRPAPVRPPHPLPTGGPGDPLVSFARSGVSSRWTPDQGSLLELAEACDVPVRWSCRTGVCHNCESALLEGEVVTVPEPLDPPAVGNVLICSATPRGDVVLDL